LAISRIRIEFHGVKDVLADYKEFINLALTTPSAEQYQEHIRQLGLKQAKLIGSVMRSLSYKVSENDIQAEAYTATGFAERERLYLNSLIAMRNIAATLSSQLDILRQQAGHPPLSVIRVTCSSLSP